MGNKEGWFHLFCPGGIACDDEGELYSIMVSYGIIKSHFVHIMRNMALKLWDYSHVLYV